VALACQIQCEGFVSVVGDDGADISSKSESVAYLLAYDDDDNNDDNLNTTQTLEYKYNVKIRK
jgi:hypothetical protein